MFTSFKSVNPSGRKVFQDDPASHSSSDGPWRLYTFARGRARKVLGPRLLLQILASLAILSVLTWSVSTPLSNAYRGTTLSYWTDEKGDESSRDLRVVVFGSQDVVGSAARGDGARETWTYRLCLQLGCASHLSFVPPDDSAKSLTSNSIYSEHLDNLNTKDYPETVYHHVKEQYPVSPKSPDLAAQVKQFLALPAPAKPPQETLWIFTFGTWDIWNLAAMPRAESKVAAMELAILVFAQIEKLYEASLDSSSIAHSDFWKDRTAEQTANLTAENSLVTPDPRRLESFRVVIPKLFDITMTPGWNDRSTSPEHYSLLQQMQNAAFITREWNMNMQHMIGSWMDRGRSTPEEEEESDASSNTKAAKQGGAPKNMARKPNPLRLAYQSLSPLLILDALTDKDMQRSGVEDGRGRGNPTANEYLHFAEVSTPCIAYGSANTAEGVGEDNGEESVGGLKECNAPDNHLFYDKFTVGTRSKEEIVEQTAGEVLEKLLAPV